MTVISARNEIETQFVVPHVRPLALPRISLVKPSHDYANSGIIYFSFTLLLLSSPARPIVAQTKLHPLHHRQRGRARFYEL